jgi:hypothetical protein
MDAYPSVLNEHGGRSEKLTQGREARRGIPRIKSMSKITIKKMIKSKRKIKNKILGGVPMMNRG